MIVLDTNVISEFARLAPDARVLAWADTLDPDDIYSTAICHAESLAGVAIMPEGRRKRETLARIEDFFDMLGVRRILHFDSAAAREYAPIVAGATKSGRPISPFDAAIAAIARAHDAAVATRNVRDFIDCGVELINPWD